MISLTPTGSPAETDAAYTLLAIIADAKASKKRLDDIVAEKQDALDALKAAQSAQTNLDASRAAAAADLATAIKIRDEANASFAMQSKQLGEQEASIADRQMHLDAKDEDLARRDAEMAEREVAVKVREDQVFTREAEAKKIMEAAQSLKSEYETKIAALRSLAS